jgi:hypothetical protein
MSYNQQYSQYGGNPYNGGPDAEAGYGGQQQVSELPLTSPTNAHDAEQQE